MTLYCPTCGNPLKAYRCWVEVAETDSGGMGFLITCRAPRGDIESPDTEKETP